MVSPRFLGSMVRGNMADVCTVTAPGREKLPFAAPGREKLPVAEACTLIPEVLRVVVDPEEPSFPELLLLVW